MIGCGLAIAPPSAEARAPRPIAAGLVERISRERLPLEAPDQFSDRHMSRPWALTWGYLHIPEDTLHG